MTDYRTLSKIASAQYDAQRMRLPGTADRLDILRKELERFHDAPQDKREIKRRWALAKLEDTERTFQREMGQIGEEDRWHIEQMRGISKAVKTVVHISVILSVTDMLKRTGSYMDIALLMAGGATVAATLGLMAERFLGGTLEGAAKNIQKAIGECRDALKSE
ncbi:hypothetical protein L0Y65_01330 [Candidatus Micrarchaeota archaeon]|nr:hypothetical protein [Candidatus Micrarchaeota archaeon]